MVKDLPGGIKQQMSLVVSLLHDPKIIFLDEPTAGVSPVARASFWDLIRKLSASGKTIFVTSHYMDEVEQCHRIALMRAGQIIALGSPEGLKTTTFPKTLFELVPANPLRTDELMNWKKEGIFESFAPYGRRYHVTVANPERWKIFQEEYADRLSIQAIKPSMEDVFLRLVEDKK